MLLWLGLGAAVGQVARGASGVWAIKAAVIVAIGGLAVALAPSLAGWFVGVAWIVLLALPTMLMRAAGWLLIAQWNALAALLGGMIRLLHPDGSWTGQPSLSWALHLAQNGRFDDAIALLRRVAGAPGVPIDTVSAARLHQRRLEGRLDLLMADMPAADLHSAQSVLLRMRALAVSGRADELIAWQAAQGWRLRAVQGPAVSIWATGLLWLWLGTGQIAPLQRLLASTLRAMPAAARRLHLAIAGLVAGLPMVALQRELSELAQWPDRDIARAAAYALVEPPAPVTLTASQVAVLKAAEADLDAYLAARAERPSLWHSPVTLCLIGLNVAVFAVELARGASESTKGLLELGAIWTPYIVGKAQWWRIGTALFLHLGWVHLSLNMLALAVLGRLTEGLLGRLRMFGVYTVAGLGSMTGLVLLMRAGWMRQELVIGASGAIMGLFGALLAITAAGWWRERSPAARRRLFLVAGLIALQAAGDIATPQVSFAGHALGLLLGLLMGLAVGHQQQGVTIFPASRPEPDATPQLDRRRVLGGAVAGGIAIVAALSYPQQLRRAAAQNGGMPGPAPMLTPVIVAAIRQLHFVFAAPNEGGAPSVDPQSPFGSTDALADLARATGLTSPRSLARTYREVMSALPEFLAQAHLAPGFYYLGRRLVMISPAQIRLIPALRWDLPEADEEIDSDPDTGAWPVSAVRPTHPYGDGSLALDMANALGLPLPRDPQGLAPLAALHRSMPDALGSFVQYAAWP